MKKFLLQLGILLLLFASGLLFLEYQARESRDTVRFKCELLKEYAPEIETLVFGPSTTCHGIKPNVFDKFSYNASIHSQPVELSWMMMKRDTSEYKKLKNVILDITKVYTNSTIPPELALSYHLYCEGRNPYSLRYLQLSDFPRFRRKLKNKFILGNVEKADSTGWIAKPALHTEKWLEDDLLKFVKAKKHLYMDIEHRPLNCTDSICSWCQRHGVRVILVLAPAYDKYFQIMEDKFGYSEKMDSTANVYMMKYENVIYHNYYSDERFVVSDYADAVHLNPEGAEKWSRILKCDFDL